MIKKIVRSMLPVKFLNLTRQTRKQWKNFYTMARGYGQWRSIKEWGSVDGNGHPIPWYTYSATEYLAHIDFTKLKIFEYGSGNSTIWWANRSNEVCSIEDDEFWYKKIQANISDRFKNVEYKLVADPEEYYKSATNEFDVYVVDGKFRKDCIEHFLRVGIGGVMLILDNSDWYPNTINYLRKNLRWIQVDFHGFGPINDYTWTTSIFINPQRNADLIYSSKLKSINWIEQCAD